MTGNTDNSENFRATVPYIDKSERFVAKNGSADFLRQFNDLYHCRLDAFRPRIIEAATKKWGADIPVRKLTDLYDSKDNCIIIGTIYKDQELKPSILKEIAEQADVVPQPIHSQKFASPGDKCILEDENLRVTLTGWNLDYGHLVTGVTVGVYGRQNEGGTFEVIDLCFPERQPPMPMPTLDGDTYVLLLSGLNFNGNKNGDSESGRCLMYCRLLRDWIAGRVGDDEELEKIAKVVRVIIAGGNISEKCMCDGREFGQIARYLTRKTAPPSVDAVQQLDQFLASIVATIDVDLMPGENDPTNHMVPQQPLHKCMLPLSSTAATLHQTTNPYCAEINGLTFLGTSGQNVADVLRFATMDDGLDGLEATYNWSQMFPTAPDTMDCYPFYDEDPFIINETPHVYFAGNQSSLQAKIVKNDGKETLLLCLPKFSETGMCALVNLRTLDVEPIVFAYELYDDTKTLSQSSMDIDIDRTAAYVLS